MSSRRGNTKAERRRRALLAQKKAQRDRWMAQRAEAGASGKSGGPPSGRRSTGSMGPRGGSGSGARGGASAGAGGGAPRHRTPSPRALGRARGAPAGAQAGAPPAWGYSTGGDAAGSAAASGYPGGSGGGPAHVYETTSLGRAPATAGPPTAAGSSVYPDQVLNKLSERISQQLRVELSDHIRREEALEHEKRQEVAGRLTSYLDTELQTHTCPVCNKLMAPPDKAPMLLFPCGHSFCKACVDAHEGRGNDTCPYCRAKIQSKAINHSLKGLIETFMAKRSSYEKASYTQPGGHAELTRRPSSHLMNGGAGVMRGATPDAGAAPGGGYAPPAYGGPPGAPHAPPGYGAYPPHGYGAYPPPAHGYGYGAPAGGGGGHPQAGWGGYGAPQAAPGPRTPAYRGDPRALPPGSAGGVAASEHDVDQATKYVHDYRNFDMRYKILGNEYQDSVKAASACNQRVQYAQAMVTQLDAQKASIEAKIKQMQAQLETIAEEKKKQELEVTTLLGQQKETQTRLQTVQTTMQGLKRDMDKSRLLVENFAPHLLGDLPPPPEEPGADTSAAGYGAAAGAYPGPQYGHGGDAPHAPSASW